MSKTDPQQPSISNSLEANETVVLDVLTKQANKDGIAWPTLKRLANLTGYSMAAVNRIITSLEQKRLVTRNYSPEDSLGRRMLTHYRINP